MTFKVSKVKETKGRVELVAVTTVLADRFTIVGGVAFYNDERGWFGKVKSSALVAFFPGGEWIVEQG